APLWEKLIYYNLHDTLELIHLLEYLQPLKREPKTIQVQAEVNQRGFVIDRKYTKILRELWRTMQATAKDEVEIITNGALKYNPLTDKHDIASPNKVKAYLTGLGFKLPDNSLNQQTVNQIIRNPE